ncbi:MAG: DUF3343 domain-containing protein [Clostridia bacterium]|nr:DUF3343 domain-containing protein [Clostridia bacterium]
MKYLIIAFKSRNELYGFARALKNHGIFLSIINSPKSIGSSCMLSIKTDVTNLNTIKQSLMRYQPKSFLGLYLIQSADNGEQILRLM